MAIEGSLQGDASIIRGGVEHRAVIEFKKEEPQDKADSCTQKRDFSEFKFVLKNPAVST